MKTASNSSWGGIHSKYLFLMVLSWPYHPVLMLLLLYYPPLTHALAKSMLLNMLACVQLRCQAIFAVLYLAYMQWVSLSLKSYISLNNMILCTHIGPVCHNTVLSVLGCISIAMALSSLHGHKKISLCTYMTSIAVKSRAVLHLWIYSQEPV